MVIAGSIMAALWSRRILAANADQMVGYDDESVELMRVLREHVFQAVNDGFQQGRRAETKQDHTGMRLMLDENQLAKVMSDEDPMFPMRDGEDVRIGLADREVADNRPDVVP